MAEKSRSRSHSKSPIPSVRSMSAGKFSRPYANQAELMCNEFLEECAQQEFKTHRQFTPRDAASSGSRMYN